LALFKLGCLVLAGMGGDSNEKKTEILLDGKEKTEILDSPQHL
jgi:hypothetical protein